MKLKFVGFALLVMLVMHLARLDSESIELDWNAALID